MVLLRVVVTLVVAVAGVLLRSELTRMPSLRGGGLVVLRATWKL